MWFWIVLLGVVLFLAWAIYKRRGPERLDPTRLGDPGPHRAPHDGGGSSFDKGPWGP